MGRCVIQSENVCKNPFSEEHATDVFLSAFLKAEFSDSSVINGQHFQEPCCRNYRHASKNCSKAPAQFEWHHASVEKRQVQSSSVRGTVRFPGMLMRLRKRAVWLQMCKAS